ncbi:MAG TPA: hypothetical protein RMH99_30790 [Sandaracinaceae bacterium LLY-WYZ-13_1]|nr:hypothetical protein [Sandaracinaceae bacterium LLY-WYZ-13_1]
MTHEETKRRAQDRLLLLATGLAGGGLVLAGGLLPVPFLGCLGLPLAMLAGLAFAVAMLACGRLEVAGWRHLVGLGLVGLGLYGFAGAYLDGLAIVVEHFLDRPGAPSLLALVHPAGRLAFAALALGAAAALRRRDGGRMGRAVAALTALTGLGAWAFLVALALLGLPLGA